MLTDLRISFWDSSHCAYLIQLVIIDLFLRILSSNVCNTRNWLYIFLEIKTSFWNIKWIHESNFTSFAIKKNYLSFPSLVLFKFIWIWYFLFWGLMEWKWEKYNTFKTHAYLNFQFLPKFNTRSQYLINMMSVVFYSAICKSVVICWNLSLTCIWGI